MRKIFSLCLIVVLFSSCGGGKTDGPRGINFDLDTFITATPDEFSNLINPVFEFIADQAVDHFEASVDGGPFQIVSSPFTVTNLVDGLHTFLVRGVDSDGNVDPTPAEYIWTVDTVNPSSFITFPTLTSLTDADSITIRGGTQEAVGVASLRIAGIDVVTTDDYQTWQANIALAKGTNIYFLESTDLAGNTDRFTDAIVVRNLGYVSNSADSCQIDSSGSFLFVMDNDRDSIFRLELASGYRQLISGSGRGTGPALTEVSDISLDEANNRVLAVDRSLDQVFAIDTNTGNRTVLSNATPGQATEFGFTYGVEYDAANNRLFVVDQLKKHVVLINLANGSRSVLVDNTIGTGPAFEFPVDLEYDAQSEPANPRLYVTDSGKIVQVDVATGNRSILSAAVPLDTVSFASIDRPKLDIPNNRLLMLQAYSPVQGAIHRKLVTVNLNNGLRADIANNLALPAADYWPFAFALSPDNQTMYTMPRSGRTTYAQTTANSDVAVVSDLNLGSGPKAGTGSYGMVNLIPGRDELAVTVGNSIIRVNTKTGDRSILVDDQVGAGPDLLGASSAVIDDITAPGTPRLLVMDSGLQTLFAVNLTSGDRTIISSPTVGAGYLANWVEDIDLDGDRVLAIEDYTGVGDFTDRLFEINLSTGNRNIISGLGNGNGVDLTSSSAVSVDRVTDPVNPRVLVSHRYQPVGLFIVDLLNGNRSLFSSQSPGTGLGPVFGEPFDSVIDAVRGEIIIADSGLESILGVNLLSGDRQIISGSDSSGTMNIGSGPPMRRIQQIDANFLDDLIYAYVQNGVMLIDRLTGARVFISL